MDLTLDWNLGVTFLSQYDLTLDPKRGPSVAGQQLRSKRCQVLRMLYSLM